MEKEELNECLKLFYAAVRLEGGSETEVFLGLIPNKHFFNLHLLNV